MLRCKSQTRPIAGGKYLTNQNIEDLKVRIRIQKLRIRDQTGQTPNLKMFQTRYKSGKITSSA